MVSDNENKTLTPPVSFKDTLNLPTTDFPIRPDHKIDDPALIERWQKEDLFRNSFSHNEGREKFILHDGPPYANGHIHLGHAYNKILKDIVTKSQRMLGKHVPVKPGWDCHGLPIELKVSQEFKDVSPHELKVQCRLYAQKWIEAQKEEFKQLGVLMNWDEPYLTMDSGYEAATVRAFGHLFKKGYIEKKKKVVSWCPYDRTVLATAEIEYKDRKDPSLFVRFPVLAESVQTLGLKDNKPVHIVVWTTTPWTLPLNRAVMIKPQSAYAVIELPTEYLIVGVARAEAIMQKAELQGKILQEIPAEKLGKLFLQHPFITDLQVPILLEAGVSTSEGTAAVHCAPGCGQLDYEVGRKHNLEIYAPIGIDGRYTAEIEPQELKGMLFSDAQGWVIKTLQDKGMLLHKESITHSYPHCWRCRNGLIFRATTQWFCNLEHDNLKERVLKAISQLSFWPEKSSNYLHAITEGRLEWCLSRQRVWGTPIPALLCKECDFVFTSEDLIERVAEGIEVHGIEYWDTVTIEELGLSSLRCAQCQMSTFIKEKDILDVWFDSGVSHYAVLNNNPALGFPADLYLEGIDQHRGWFQSSILTSMILEGMPSMKGILTHAFIVDEYRQKMSKSIGNVVEPNEIIKQYGTDCLRLWSSVTDYASDAVISKPLLQNVEQVYRKIRNTCRFLLSNLYDFDSKKDAVALDKLPLIDTFALVELIMVNESLQNYYKDYNMTAVYHQLSDYCTVNLSAQYLDIIKDRLYTAAPTSFERRSAQTVCWLLLDTLTKIMAPILSFTAELISDHYQKDKTTSIHLQEFNALDELKVALFGTCSKEQVADDLSWQAKSAILQTVCTIEYGAQQYELLQWWELVLKMRSALLKLIEVQREQGMIKHSLEAKLSLFIELPEAEQRLLERLFKKLRDQGVTFETLLKEVMIVSQVELKTNKQGLAQTELKGLYAHATHADGTKCPRCWQWDITTDVDGLCRRCQKIIRK
jgi:isoleucyl-tRNA synthetase